MQQELQHDLRLRRSDTPDRIVQELCARRAGRRRRDSVGTVAPFLMAMLVATWLVHLVRHGFTTFG